MHLFLLFIIFKKIRCVRSSFLILFVAKRLIINKTKHYTRRLLNKHLNLLYGCPVPSLHYFFLLHVWNYTLSKVTGLFPQIPFYGLQCGVRGWNELFLKSLALFGIWTSHIYQYSKLHSEFGKSLQILK